MITKRIGAAYAAIMLAIADARAAGRERVARGRAYKNDVRAGRVGLLMSTLREVGGSTKVMLNQAAWLPTLPGKTGAR